MSGSSLSGPMKAAFVACRADPSPGNFDSDRMSGLAWQDYAACADADVNEFFPEHGGHRDVIDDFCARCPVQRECRAYATANRERFGVWGGETQNARERRLMGTGPGSGGGRRIRH